MTSWGKRHWYVLAGIAIFAVATEQHSYAASTLTPPSPVAGWSLSKTAECHQPSQVERRMFEGVRASRRVCRAEYSGTSQIRLTLYDMPGGPAATAFDAFQRWRTQPFRMGFFRGSVFGVAEAPEADENTLNRFVIALEAALPPGNEARR